MVVKIKIEGLTKSQAFFAATNIGIERNVKSSILKAARHVQNEVKQSISGHRPEPTSVDTGRFLNSVDIKQSGFDAEVFTDLTYPKDLENGTSKIPARRHFANTAAREKVAVKSILAASLKGL